MFLIYHNVIDDGLLRRLDVQFDESTKVKFVGKGQRKDIQTMGAFSTIVDGKTKIYADRHPVSLDRSMPAYERNQKKGNK